ncbi:hypothetical protein ACFW2U_33340, partial [Streptomyces sp. NPDC058876]
MCVDEDGGVTGVRVLGREEGRNGAGVPGGWVRSRSGPGGPRPRRRAGADSPELRPGRSAAAAAAYGSRPLVAA